MRIDRLHLKNFKGFADESFGFDQRFTLLIGENGAGKTSILSAAAVALGIWDQNAKIKRTIRVTEKAWRKIYDDEVRLVFAKAGDRGLFKPEALCEITAEWNVDGRETPLKWSRRLENGKRKNIAKDVVKVIDKIVDDADAQKAAAPLLAYYGAGRAWLPSNERVQRSDASPKKPSQWDGYYDCLQERIRLKDLDRWFRDEAAARDNGGEWRLGYLTVRQAILNCIPHAKEIHWDASRSEICLNIGGATVPFSMLSDGQKTMASMVADLAIRAVTLNSFLFGDSRELSASPALSVVLQKTPGVVLIDEIDVHLHPKWQRRVVADLRRTFPEVQFICTSHSPQVIGELPTKNIFIYSSRAGEWRHPNRSFGVDSSRILEEEMEADSRNHEEKQKLSELADVIDQEDFGQAEHLLKEVVGTLGEDDPEVTRARTLMAFLRETK